MSEHGESGHQRSERQPSDPSHPEQGAGGNPPWRREFRVAVALGQWAAARMRHDVGARTSSRVPTVYRAKAHPADLVTSTDQTVEAHVRRVLTRHFPRYGLVGEELRPRAGRPGAPVWLVDPVDGTTNFAHDLGWSCFSLGLADLTGPLLAVVVDPWRAELFTAVTGQGASCNGRPLVLPRRDGPAVDPLVLDGGRPGRLEGQVVLTEWAGHRPWPGMQEMAAALADRWCTVRVMGSTALSIVQVAAGRAAAAVIGAGRPIDVQAATLIATEAGAVARDPGGGPPLWHRDRTDAGRDGAPDQPLLVARAELAEELLRLWPVTRGSERPADRLPG